jgi:diaminopimelate decarboxylase
MAKEDRKLEEKVRPYRIVFHNTVVDSKAVEAAMREELPGVEVDDWEEERVFNYMAKVDPRSVATSPQRLTVVRVKYREYVSQ